MNRMDEDCWRLRDGNFVRMPAFTFMHCATATTARCTINACTQYDSYSSPFRALALLIAEFFIKTRDNTGIYRGTFKAAKRQPVTSHNFRQQQCQLVCEIPTCICYCVKS